MGSSLLKFLLRRLAAAVLLMLGVTVMTFALTNVVPSNPLSAALGEAALADPEIVATYVERYGLNEPLPVQYLTYMRNLAQGDFGRSRRTNRPIRDDLAEYAPATIELAVVAVFLAITVGVAAGTAAAMFHNRFLDQAIRVGSLIGVSMPLFWLALVAFYVFSIRLSLLDGIGRLDPGMIPPPRITGAYTIDSALGRDWVTFRSAVEHLLLPAIVLAIYASSVLTRFVRSAVLDSLSQDFIRTSRAKGLGEGTVALRHGLRAALVPIVTMLGVIFGVLLSGSVFVEAIFGYAGLGQYAYRSAIGLDLPAVMGITVIVAALYITINLIVDLLYGVIDPRVRLS